jgi:hypothetical protein
VQTGQARAVLVLNPEITSAHLNFRDRDSHFIFGDACTAMIIEAADTATSEHQFEILESKLKTKFSNNIRNNFGFMNRFDEAGIGKADKLFRQQGRKVFKEVCPMAAEMIRDTVEKAPACASQVSRYWLHQANLNMNLLIARTLLGRDADAGRGAGDPRHLCEYLVGRVDHCLPQVPGRPAGRREWRDLLVRRRVFDRLRGGAQEVVSVLHGSAPVPLEYGLPGAHDLPVGAPARADSACLSKKADSNRSEYRQGEDHSRRRRQPAAARTGLGGAGERQCAIRQHRTAGRRIALARFAAGWARQPEHGYPAQRCAPERTAGAGAWGRRSAECVAPVGVWRDRAVAGIGIAAVGDE